MLRVKIAKHSPGISTHQLGKGYFRIETLIYQNHGIPFSAEGNIVRTTNYSNLKQKIMKKIIITVVTIYCIIAMNTASAQDSKPERKSSSISIGAESAIPTGDLSLTTPLGLGGSVKGVFPIANFIDFTISAGYIYFLKKKIEDESFGGFHSIPLKGGFRFMAGKGFYVEPQAGYSIFGSDGGGSSGAFTYAGNIGYLINNKVDVSARYESATKEGSSLSHVGIRIAYNFSLSSK